MNKVKLDKRFAGYVAFKWGIDFAIPGRNRTVALATFNQVRDWCTATWGQSCEIENYLDFIYEPNKDKNLHTYEPNNHWAWKSSTESFKSWRIYFKTDDELSLFTLRWGVC